MMGGRDGAVSVQVIEDMDAEQPSRLHHVRESSSIKFLKFHDLVLIILNRHSNARTEACFDLSGEVP